MGRFKAYGYTFDAPTYTKFRGKKYRIMPGSYSQFKDVAQKYAEGRRRLGHPTIVKTVVGRNKRDMKKKLYILYRREK